MALMTEVPRPCGLPGAVNKRHRYGDDGECSRCGAGRKQCGVAYDRYDCGRGHRHEGPHRWIFIYGDHARGAVWVPFH